MREADPWITGIAPWVSFEDQSPWDAVEPSGRSLSWEDGEIVDTKDRIFLIRSGMACITALSPDGSQRSLGLLGPGSLLGDTTLFMGKALPEEARAVTPCTALAYSATAVTRDLLPRHPALALYMLRNMAEKSYLMSSQLFHISLLSSERRMAHFFYHLYLEQEKQSHIYAMLAALPLTALAEITGMHRVTVTSIVNSFKRMNVIERKKEQFVINDPQGLYALINPS